MNTILGFSPWEILRRGGGIGTETGIRFVGHVCDEADDDEGELYGDEELQQSIRRFYGIASDDNNYDDRGKDFRSSSDTVVGEAQKVIKRSRVELLALTDLPHWQQHGSELIHSGYRKACGSIWGCLHSWSYLHNETVNIYSHIIGAIVFLLVLPFWLVTTTIPPRLAMATNADIFACGVWLFGVGICFVLSTAFHTLMSHSQPVYHLGMKLDFQGILLLMWGATVPLIYYSFPCQTTIQTSYYLATTTLALLCSITTLVPYFSGPHVGHLRAALFASFGLGSFLVPIIHGIMLYGLEEQKARISLGWIGMLVTCNGVGCVVYTIKFPERWFPGTFDIWGASHQVMHVMVVLAALSYTVAIVDAFDYLHEYGPAVCGG